MRNIFYVTPGEPDWHCHLSNSLLTIICLACQNCLLIHLLICPFKKDDIIIIVIIDDNLLILCWLYILQSNPSFPIAHSQSFQCNFASSGLTQQKGESGLWVILGHWGLRMQPGQSGVRTMTNKFRMSSGKDSIKCLSDSPVTCCNSAFTVFVPPSSSS